MKTIHLKQIHSEDVVTEIGQFILEKTKEFGFNGGVVGLSGGVDSTTVAIIANEAYKKAGLELVGYILPSKTNNPADMMDGIKVANKLGIRYQVIDIEPLVDAFGLTNQEAMDKAYHKGNLMSRIRACVLHTKSATENKIVLGTGNRDEDYGVGYYTLFGDGAVHISPIGNLPKRLVKQIASKYGFEDIAERTPTAGLEPGQTDMKDLGYSYDMVEFVSEGLLLGMSQEELLQDEQILEQGESEIRNYMNIYGVEKFTDVPSMVGDILKRHAIADKKAALISPAIAPVTFL